MNIYEAIRFAALRNVVKEGDLDYAMRKIFRWYSKTFHTPLHVVEELPTEYILQHYWESQYEDLDEQKLEQETVILTKTEAQKKAEDKAWDAEQAEEVEFAKVAAAMPVKIADLKPEPTKPLVPEPPPAPTQLENTVEKVNQLTEILSNIKELPPDVHMSFVSEEEMEDLMGDDSIPFPKKPKSPQS